MPVKLVSPTTLLAVSDPDRIARYAALIDALDELDEAQPVAVPQHHADAIAMGRPDVCP